MSIDGVGKPRGVAPAGPTGALSPTAETGAPFSVGAAAPSAAARGSVELGQLQRGELSLDAYLDARVSSATQHLQGQLEPEQLEFVQQTLREQLATDPVLSELARRTTGVVPPEPSE